MKAIRGFDRLMKVVRETLANETCPLPRKNVLYERASAPCPCLQAYFRATTFCRIFRSSSYKQTNKKKRIKEALAAIAASAKVL